MSTDTENVDETVEMPEYPLSSAIFTVNNVDSAHDEHGNIINFDMPDKIMFFKKINDKVHVTILVSLNGLRPAVSVFDTGAGPIFIQTSFLPLNDRRECTQLLAFDARCHPVIISPKAVWSYCF